MNDSLLFEKLEHYALSHTCFTSSLSSDDDFREQYVHVLNKKRKVIPKVITSLMSIWTSLILQSIKSRSS